MDAAVGLVQAYLRINGFFTVTEYPIVSRAHGTGKTLTDADILAVRFPGAGRWVPGDDEMLPADPLLELPAEGLSMIIGEVKEGRSRLNPPISRKDVVETVIRRFGCCSRDPEATAQAVIQNGFADTIVDSEMSCRIQWVAFGGSEPEIDRSYHVVPLRHVAQFLSSHIDQYRDVFLKTEFKDEALALMALLRKVDLPFEQRE